jgi:hypothetical protein
MNMAVRTSEPVQNVVGDMSWRLAYTKPKPMMLVSHQVVPLALYRIMVATPTTKPKTSLSWTLDLALYMPWI